MKGQRIDSEEKQMAVDKYGFIQEELNRDGMKRKYCYAEAPLVMIELDDTQGEELAKQMVSDQWEQLYKDRKKQLETLSCHMLLLAWSTQEEEQLLFLSDTKSVRALDFLDYLIGDFGLVKGTANCGSGRISSAILKVQMSGEDMTDTMEYFLKMAASYYQDCDRIRVEDYAETHAEEIYAMQSYCKRKISWAYVRSTDVAEPGHKICMKTLENEAGLTVKADENIYIMIGCRGEVYDITREKFEKTYEPTEEPLDVFERMLDFLPAVETVPEGAYVSLDEVAHLCYPKPGAGIYAKELTRRTRVYPVDRDQEYFLGRPGDYLAIRKEDIRDIYVIQKEIFRQTYEEE